MGAEKDNPFARWSRLKQAARQAEAAHEPEDTAKPSGQETTGSGDAKRPPCEAAAGPDTTEPPEPLPRIEDLTPQSDLSAFLGKGIPATLKNTALRKMWSLDPAIRDYIGPAEYAWDFNTPGSMRGFGALEAGKSIANFLSRVASSDGQDAPAEPEAEPLHQAVAALGEDANAQAATGVPENASEAPETTEPTLPTEHLEASQYAEDAAKSRKSRLSRHGRALPR